MRFARSLVLASFTFSALAGCAAPTAETEPTASDEGELRALKPEEYVGFLQYGDTTQIAYTDTPTYRAYRFRANAFDRVSIEVKSTTPGTAPWAALLNADGHEISQSKGGTNYSARVGHTMGDRFGELTLVVRELSAKAATLEIKLSSTGVKEPAFPFAATPGSYAPPPALAGKSVDVMMTCLDRRYAADKTSYESVAGGIVSLSFAATGPAVTGADDALTRLEDASLGIAKAPGALTPPAFANALTLVGLSGSTGSHHHVLQLTNDAPNRVRVEYALESIGGNTGTPAQHLSCVGIATP